MGDQKVFGTANMLHQFVIVTLQSKSCNERNLAYAAKAVGYLPVGQMWFSLLTLGAFLYC